MSEASERVEAWRRAKRKAGYRPVLLWLPLAFKGELDALAYARGQDPAAYVMDAVRAYQGTRKPLRLEGQQLHQLKEEIKADLLGWLVGQGGLDAASAPPRPAAPPPADVPLPAGLKRCKQGHVYPSTRAECPDCVRARKRRYRERQTQATTP